MKSFKKLFKITFFFFLTVNIFFGNKDKKYLTDSKKGGYNHANQNSGNIFRCNAVSHN